MTNHYIVYSHGFGVRKDGRGLMTDIVTHLPDYEHVLFDYNEFDEATNTLVARPFDQQAAMLLEQIAIIRRQDAHATIDIIAHSQGCVAAALANPSDVRNVIMLAPPAEFLGLEQHEIYTMRPDTTTDDDGTIYMPRRDGTTTIIKEDYWKSREGIMPIELYDKLATHTNVSIVTATKDEVLTNTDFSRLDPAIKLIELESNHDFTGEYREPLLSLVAQLLSE